MASKTWLLGIVTVGVFGSALLSAACGSDGSAPSGSSQSNLDDQAPSASKPAPSASSSSAAPGVATSAPVVVSTSGGPTTTPPGDPNGDACYNTCDSQHPTGSNDYDDLEAACICVPSRCATECAQSECNDSDNAPDPVDGDACDTCMAKYENDDGTGDCDKQIEAALKAKGGDDAALQSCYDACP